MSEVESKFVNIRLSPREKLNARVKHLCLGFAILLLPFSDLNLGIGGAFLRSISAIPMFILALMLLPEIFKHPKRAILLLWLALIISFTFLQLSTNDNRIFEQSLLNKSITNTVFLLTFFLPATLYDADIKTFRWWISAAFWLCILGFVCGDILKLDLFHNIGPLHSLENIQQRPRGLTTESSIFGLQFLILACLMMQAFERRTSRILLSVIVIWIIAIGLQSKGAIISIIITLVLALLVYFRHNVLFWLIFLISAVVFLLSSEIWSPFLHQLSTYLNGLEGTSFSTRITLYLTAFGVIATHPMGAGLGTSATEILEILPTSIDVTQSLFAVPFRISELYEHFLVANTDRYITTKFGLGDFLLLVGWPGILFLYYIYKSALSRALKNKYYFIYIGTLFSLLAFGSYASFFGNYSMSVILIFSRFSVRTSHR